MGFMSARKLASMTLLSVVLPMSLLVTFRLTGVLREPLTPEAFTVDEVTWEMERPFQDTRIAENIKSVYYDHTVSMNASVSVHRYYENAPDDPYWNRDGVSFRVNINAATLKGSIAFFAVEFLPLDANSTLYINPTFSSYHNVTVTRVKGIGTSAGVNFVEAEVSASPCSMRLPIEWVFTDQSLENHQLRVNIKVTHFNGETYRTTILPIVLRVLIASTQG